MTWQLIHADCIEAMQQMDEASVDAIVTDPPYGLEFMGKEWDRLGDVRQPNDPTFHKSGSGPHDRATVRYGYDVDVTVMQRWHHAWVTEALRVLKPGAHLLAFGGTRTFHRLTCALEDAGFEIRDCLSWLYGSGFPKSLNLDGEWQGWGTALKPAWEPIILARKPLAERNVASNVQRFGTGALNIDGARIGERDESKMYLQPRPTTDSAGASWSKGEHVPFHYGESGGRWPPNVALDEQAAEMLDEQSGEREAGRFPGRQTVRPFAGQGPSGYRNEVAPERDLDTGGASRFMYVAKADRAERERGLEHLTRVVRNITEGHGRGPVNTSKASDDGIRENRPAANVHPTVKPVALMQWLVRLVTPPGGTVLDPFTGSGSTGIAALREGFDFTGIEREAEYVEIARARIQADAPLFNVAAEVTA